VIAYRKILISENKKYSGKSNIDFANDAFSLIREMRNCVAITLDISNFFESLDHDRIKEKWCRILNVKNLPDDHFKVFKHIKDYRTVDFDKCYERLGFLVKNENNGKIQKLFKFSRKEQPKQLCSDMREFREKIIGKNSSYETLVLRNPYLDKNSDMKRWGKHEAIERRGIPQGSPISDVLANIYLLDFDLNMKNYVVSLGRVYRRYSDDILIIVPCEISKCREIIEFSKSKMKNEGNYIKIKDSKTIITEFFENNEKINYSTYDSNFQNINKPFEYLGFAFDGVNSFLRPQTLSRFYKRMSKGIKAAVRDAEIKAKANLSSTIRDFFNESEIYHRFSKTNPHWKDKKGNKSRNFLNYVKRAAEIMKSETIIRQMRNHRKKIRSLIDTEVDRIRV